jgi:BirA family biotin operon repressor/biotin-[acetyl-CoA-carboxylase] ligase
MSDASTPPPQPSHAPAPAQPSPAPQPLERWPDALEAALRGCTLLRRAIVVRETASTQDHARAGAAIGDAVVAWRQTAGRGRLGRAWADTADAGIAATVVVPRGGPEFLACASAVAAARAAIALGVPHAGIKWPNDILAGGRKLCGILVEQTAEAAFVGVGMNVLQRRFDPPLDARATSLALEGAPVDRLEALVALLRALDTALQEPEEAIFRTYQALDRLSGTQVRLRTPQEEFEAMVLSVDPRRGLVVSTAQGRRELPAATTSIVPPPDASRYGVADASA